MRAALLALALLAACSGVERERFTAAEQASAIIPGIPDARAWADGVIEGLAPLGMAPAEVEARRAGDLDYLALSSGGPAGAYGAGVLVGWSAAGTRPVFDVVTGVSSGALIAPFAFVGPEADADLQELWAGGLIEELGRNPNYLGLATGRGIVDPAPLRRLVDQYVDDALIAGIAEGHREGRRLIVVTANLDAQRPVAWNLGAIAASGRPEAPALIRDLLVASASVPVAVRPVLIDAVAGERVIQEMHVDGGTASQVFAFPDAVLLDPSAFAVPRGVEARLWLLVNYVVAPEFGNTPGTTFGLGARAYGTLIKSDVRSEVFAIAAAAEDAGFDLHLATIRHSVAWSPTNPFATEFMRTMFDLGRAEGLGGRAFVEELG